MVISIKEITESKQQTLIREYEPLKEVAGHVSRAQLIVINIERLLDDMRGDGSAPALSKVRFGLNVFEESDRIQTALWTTREELIFMQALDSSEENLALYQAAFRVIGDLMQTISELKSSVGNIMTASATAGDHIARAQRKTRLLKLELPEIMEFINLVEM